MSGIDRTELSVFDLDRPIRVTMPGDRCEEDEHELVTAFVRCAPLQVCD
jgi:hypothetical protein